MLAGQAPLLLAGGCSSNPGPTAAGLPFTLGIASYTFREFSLEETIRMTNRLDIKKLCLKSMHLPLELSPEEIESAAAKVRDAGLDLYAGGVIYMKTRSRVFM